MSDWLHPPYPDEVEVTLFGPSKGECVLLHIGRGDWIVVDSCRDRRGQPAALVYLTSLGVSSDRIKMIVASHWHDDHVGGLARLVQSCPQATFVFSGSLEADEFLHLVSAADLRPMVKTTSGVHEFRRILDHLASHGVGPHFALVDRILYRRTGSLECTVQALSPSDASVLEGFERIKMLLNDQLQDAERLTVPRPERNPGAVVLWVTVGSVLLLLGSDLEIDDDPAKGWTAVLDAVARPTEPASFVKIAHHGSVNGHDDRAWDQLLEPAPHAALTPYLSGKTPIPRPADLTRIVGLTPNAWITRRPGTPKVKRDYRVERMAEEATRWIRAADPLNAGVVRFRRQADAAGPWRVHSSGSAERLT